MYNIQNKSYSFIGSAKKLKFANAVKKLQVPVRIDIATGKVIVEYVELFNQILDIFNDVSHGR